MNHIGPSRCDGTGTSRRRRLSSGAAICVLAVCVLAVAPARATVLVGPDFTTPPETGEPTGDTVQVLGGSPTNSHPIFAYYPDTGEMWVNANGHFMTIMILELVEGLKDPSNLLSLDPTQNDREPPEWTMWGFTIFEDTVNDRTTAQWWDGQMHGLRGDFKIGQYGTGLGEDDFGPVSWWAQMFPGAGGGEEGTMVVTVIPEPGTLALLGLGAVGVLLRRRTRA